MWPLVDISMGGRINGDFHETIYGHFDVTVKRDSTIY